MGPSVAKIFFLHVDEVQVSGYTGVWYKNI